MKNVPIAQPAKHTVVIELTSIQLAMLKLVADYDERTVEETIHHDLRGLVACSYECVFGLNNEAEAERHFDSQNPPPSEAEMARSREVHELFMAESRVAS